MAAEINLRAERRAGELLRGMEKAKGNQHTAARSHDVTEQVAPKLTDLGLTKSQSSRFQQVAAVPEERFEAHIAETKAKGGELTSAGVRKS